jgi:prepilin-type N-terminal cleavage/methylation domain-containing protein
MNIELHKVVAARFRQPLNREPLNREPLNREPLNREPLNREPLRHSSGFTLLELLVVIAIIMTISSILVASYFGMMRGSSYAATQKNVFNALTLARQRACIDGKRTNLMFQNSNEFALVHSAGRVTDVSPGFINDAYADVSEGNRQINVYNLDANGVTTVRNILRYDRTLIPDPISGTYTRSEIRFTVDSSAAFGVGDRYGFEVYQAQQLPKGFYCKVESEDHASLTLPDPILDNNKVIFEPDGRRGARSITKIVVYENIIGESSSFVSNRVTFSISPDGKISVQ